jgi:beta-galactosidase
MSVEVYSRYDTVRLYLNDTLVEEKPTTSKENFRALFHLDYQPGILKAAGVRGGQEVEEFTLATAGNPASVRLTPDRTMIQADGEDLSFISVEVVDKEGRLQPNANQNITFALTGPGTIAGVGNANLKSEEPYQGNERRVFHGQAQVVIRSTKQPGTIELKARADGLAPATISIQAR